MNFIPWAIGGLLLIALIIWLIFINKKKKVLDPFTGEQEIPTTEGESGEIHSI